MDFKMENGSYIKPDPENTSRAFHDEDAYEDTGELEFPKEPRTAWLVRLPKTLYGNWAHMGADEPIQVGTIRHFKQSGRMRLFLNPSVPQNQGVSKEYDIRTAVPKSKNTYVFSEKDLPGFKSKNKGGSGYKPDDKKDVLAATSQGGVDKSARFNSFRRKAVPKQTGLAATITREVTCNPVDLETEARTRRLDAEDKKGITILKGDVRNYARLVIDPTADRSIRNRANFDHFKTDSVPTKAKPQENKTSRMPQNELLDALYDCFKRYRYWSMTALRQELHQPEAYLRQTLLLIAEQVRSGPFNNHWKLRAEQELPNIDMNAIHAMKEESAPQRDGGDVEGASSAPPSENEEDEDDDEDDDLQMEDVGI